MSEPVSGNGGSFFFQVDPSDAPSADDNIEIPIGKWALDKNERVQEVTRSYHSDGTRYTAITCDPIWTLDLPFDKAEILEQNGFDKGTLIEFALFRIGESDGDDPATSTDLYYEVDETIVETFGLVSDANGDIVRIRITGRGGDVLGPDTLFNLGFLT